MLEGQADASSWHLTDLQLSMVGIEAMKVRFELTSLKALLLSLASLEDAGWRLGHQNDRLVVLFSVVVISPCRWTGLTMSTGSSAWRCWSEKSLTW